MCGRVTLTIDFDEMKKILHSQYQVETPRISPYLPRYNIAPSQPLVTLIHDGSAFRAGELRWGMMPAWQRRNEASRPLANARAETLLEKPTFRDAFLKRRCIILVDSYYEWRTRYGEKAPFRILSRTSPLLCLAGLWSYAESVDGKHGCCVIVTTEANPLIRPIHHRMPLLLTGSQIDAWARPDTPPEVLEALLKPYDADDLDMYEVSKLVNNARIDAPDCIQEVHHRLDDFDQPILPS